MEPKGPNLTSGSYYTVIYVILHSQIFSNAMATMHEMLLNYFFSSVSSYKQLIVVLCNENLVDDALQILEQTIKHNFIPFFGTLVCSKLM